MAYFAPYIDATGLHLPTYQDILDNLIQQAKNIFGQDIYLGVDSQDYQWISVVAAKINDTLQTIQFAYDSHSPVTAIGAGLDTLVKLNGIARIASTYSTAVVTLTGTPNTVINNGVAQDKSNYKWNLPSSITIGTGGTVDATVTCQAAGAIYANPGDINVITTPTYGWASVTNANAATPGVATEKDSQLKSRQAISTALPSRTVLEGTKGAIAAVSNVTRFQVYENDTNVADVNGLPPHSITALVEGGADADIAQAIFNKKGPGGYTNGTTSVNVTDQYGQVNAIRFYRPTYVDIDVVVNVKQLSGYTTATTLAIQAAIAAFLNGMSMGVNDIPVNNFFGPALSAQNLSSSVFSVTSITAARHGGVQGTADITTAFNEAVRGNTAYVTVNIT
ncbi:baseplate J/gp47 family protein [Paradesulfitobacterium aromaticivorans]